jgi:quinolinate synthase
MEQEALKADIRRLLKDRNAVLLAHNYQRDEIQEIADITGDSLALSQEAAKSAADVIVFCGVHFMAESAFILAPQKTVLLPRIDAGCPMADMVTADALRAWRSEHPGAVVVTYVNSSADVKAESDICCTSGNVVNVVRSIPEDREIFMVPDRNLAQYAAEKTGRKLSWWDGYCPTHERLSPADIEAARAAHLGAPVVVHPECRPEVVAMADAVLSTAGMYSWCAKSPAKEFIIGTEMGILYKLRRDNPGKAFHLASRALVCPNMKLTTLEDVRASLVTLSPSVTVPADIREKAVLALEAMIRIPRDAA